MGGRRRRAKRGKKLSEMSAHPASLRGLPIRHGARRVRRGGTEEDCAREVVLSASGDDESRDEEEKSNDFFPPNDESLSLFLFLRLSAATERN